MQKSIRKLLSTLLVLAMVVSFLPVVDLGIEAKAAGVVATDVVFDYIYDVSPYRDPNGDGTPDKVDVAKKITNLTQVQENTARELITNVYRNYPGKDGYVFAGWYADTVDMNPLGQDVVTGGAYAKFVPASLITAVAQVSVNTNHTTASSAMRFIAAVDSLEYNQIGFTITKKGAGAYVHSSTKVYGSLSAALEGASTVEPGFFGAAANYMYALTVTGITNQSQEYTAKPFWITEDGTLVNHVVSGEKTVAMGVAANIAAGKQTNPAPDNTDWYDAGKTEYVINTKEEFVAFVELSKTQNFAGKTIKLGADIEFNPGIAGDKMLSTASGNPYLDGVEAYTPIGSTSVPFAGTFDGQGHTISGLASKTGHDGVFAAISGATIRNLKVTRSTIRGGSGGGLSAGLVAISRGTSTIENVYIGADVNLWGASHMGGVVGTNQGKLTVRNVWSVARINPQWVANINVGGIVAVNSNVASNSLTLENCLYTGAMAGTAQGDSYIGGLVGACGNALVTTITDCLSAGSMGIVTSTGKLYMGSVVGSKSWTGANTVTTGVYATAECYSVEGEAQLIRADQSFASGVTAVAKTNLYGEKARTNAAELNYAGVWAPVAGGTPELAAFSAKTDISWYDADKSVYVLENMADMYGFVYMSQYNSFSGKTVKLATDITLNTGASAGWLTTAPSQTWLPIGNATYKFAGTFDGQGHTISGLYTFTDSNTNSGLFFATQGATIKNLTITNSCFNSSAGSGQNGILVGAAYGGMTVENVHATNSVYVNKAVNIGLIGYIANAGTYNLNKNSAAADLRGLMYTKHVGGIVGYIENAAAVVNMTDCLFTGKITVTGNGSTCYAGGLLGGAGAASKVYFTNCVSAPTIDATGMTSAGYIGSAVGLTSYNNGYASVTNVYATNAYQNSSGDYVAIDAARVAGSAYTGSFTLVDEANLYGDLAKTNASALDYALTWKTVTDGVPVLSQRLVDTSWYNNTDTEFVITTAAELNGFAELSKTNTFSGKTVKLGADIVYNEGNAADWATTAPANVWAPIGDQDNGFLGTFDGQGHTVSGLYCVDTSYASFVARLYSPGVVKNVRIVNSYLRSNGTDNTYSGAGIVTRLQNATVSGIYTNAILESTTCAGIVATVPSGTSTVSNCWFDGTVVATNATRAGGIIGLCNSTAVHAVSNCLFTGTFTAGKSGSYYGGLIGLGNYNATVTATNCLAAGDMTAVTAGTVGSVIGNNPGGNRSTYTNVYATNETHTNLAGAGGTLSKFTVTAVAKADILGDLAKTGAPNLDYTVIWATNEGGVPTPTGATYADKDLSWYGDGSATTFTLYDADDLYGFAYMASKVNFSGKTVKLGADIVVNEGNAADWAEEAPARAWTSIGSTSLSFVGTFDGQDHTISGLYQKGSIVGLFGDVSKGGKVQNLKLLNSYFEGTGTMAAIAAYSTGSTCSFTNIYTDAILVGANQVGGIIGRSYGGATTNITGCTFAGSINATQYAAGFVGIIQNAGIITITDSAFTGSVTVTAQDGAGFVGMVSANQASKVTINNSTASGTVTGPICGGFVGRIGAHSGTAAHSINNSTFTGKVTSTGGTIAGFVGYTQANITIDGSTFEGTVSGQNYTAGFVGQALSTVQITEATAAGTVAATADNAAALVAYNTGAVTISDSAVSTKVSAANYAAGYVGKVTAAVTISGSTFDGDVSATTSYAGGFIARIDGGTTNISSSEAHGTVTISTAGAAGFIGYIAPNYTGNLTDCWTDATVTAASNVGGLVGRFDKPAYGTFTNCLATGKVVCTGWGNNGQFIGYSNQDFTVVNSYWASNSGSTATDKGYTGSYPTGCLKIKASATEALIDLYKAGEFPDVPAFLATESNSTFTISTKADLFAFALASQYNNFSGKTVKLAGDIVINDAATYGNAETWDRNAPKYGWIAISNDSKPFAGTFDGQGNTISGVYCEYAGGNGMGLFSFVSGTIKNFRLENSYFENTVSVDYGYNGSVAGYLSGTISQVYSNAVLKTVDSWPGGIVGMVAGAATITECQFDGRLMARCDLHGGCTETITGDQANQFAGGEKSGRGHAVFVGGIAGCLKGTSVNINNCHFTGHIYNECQNAHRTGGIMGGINAGTATITQCISAGHFYTANMLANSGNSYHFNMIMDTRGLGGKPTNNATLFTDNYVMTRKLYDIRGNVKNADGNITGASGCGVSTIRYTDATLVEKLEADLAAGTNNLDYTNIWYYNVGAAPTLRFGDTQGESSTYYINTSGGDKILMMGMSGETTDTYTDMTVIETEYTGETYSLDADGDGTPETYNCLYLEQQNAAAVPFKDIFYGDGTYITKYVNTTKADADKLIADMVAYGFDVHTTNNLNSDCYYTALTFGKNVYAVTFFARTGETYVSASNQQKLSPYMQETYFETAVNVEGGEPYTAYDTVTITSVALVNGGDAFVIRLKNGHFLVIDGGTNNQTDRDAITAALGASADEYNAGTKNNPRVVVDGWFFTHAHADHTAFFRGGIYGAGQVDVYIKGFYFNFAQKWHEEAQINLGSAEEPNYVTGFVNKAYAYKDQDENGKNYYTKGLGDTSEWWLYRTAVAKTASNVNNPTWDDPAGAKTAVNIPIYRVQAGQKFYFDGMTVEVPYTQEQVQPSEMQLDLNGTCSWFLLTDDVGHTFMDAGDAEYWNAEAVVELYSPSYGVFGADICKTFHHGLNPLVKHTGTFGKEPNASTAGNYDYSLADKIYGINTGYGDGSQTRFMFITKTAASWVQISGYNSCGGSQRDLSIHEMYYLFGYILPTSYGTPIRDYESYGYKRVATVIPFAAYGGTFTSGFYTDTFEGTTTVTFTDNAGAAGVSWSDSHTNSIYN